jgi:hypothetical protein
MQRKNPSTTVNCVEYVRQLLVADGGRKVLLLGDETMREEILAELVALGVRE